MHSFEPFRGWMLSDKSALGIRQKDLSSPPSPYNVGPGEEEGRKKKGQQER